MAKFFSTVKKNYWIILLLFYDIYLIYSHGFRLGHIDGINEEGVYNLLFPLFPIISSVFPLRSMIYFLWKIIPDYLVCLKYLYIFLPTILTVALSVNISSFTKKAGQISLVLSLLLMQNPFFYDVEQVLITSCVLLSVSTFYSIRRNSKFHIAATTAALCVCMHSKGICFPFCLIMFAMLFYESFSTKKNIAFVSVCFVFFLLGGIVWSTVATRSSNRIVLFTENSDRLIPNLIGGAYGMVQTVQGDINNAMELNNMTFWQICVYAVKIIVNHPINYMKGILLRILWLCKEIRYFAPLFLLFLYSCFFSKKVRKSIPLVISAIYFFMIYILMPVEPRYFVPTIFLMCTCVSFFLSYSLSIEKN